MPKHTPGPWHYGEHSGDERTDGSDWGADGLWTADNKLILGVGDGWDGAYEGPTNPADKALIAAAPRLLAALAELVRLKDDDSGWGSTLYARDMAWAEARAALAEAQDWEAIDV